MSMQTTRPLVSIIVPTLNRGRYVVRAVQSCLDADVASVDVDLQVIVLDSKSDDGSWEDLVRQFSNDPRVILQQNDRGLGPTRSWLDGAKFATGDFVTFLWSDDYFAPFFFSDLVPILRNGAALAIGYGVERDIDDETPMVRRTGEGTVTASDFLAGYFRRGMMDHVDRPFSPACSLFNRAAFQEWFALVENWSTANELRRKVLWKRAIGPDLLLYLVAVAVQAAPIPCIRSNVTQFSVHAGSITKSSSRLPFEQGYWLAALWYLTDERAQRTLSEEEFARFAGAMLAYGVMLAFVAAGYGQFSDFKLMWQELHLIRRAAACRGTRFAFYRSVLCEAITTPFRLICYRNRARG